jgi:iron complex transport system substrate-binding protein
MKILMRFLTLFVLVFLLTACGNQQAGDAQDQPVKQEQDGETDSGKADDNQQQSDAFPVTITDAMDNEVTIKEKPKGIVSLVPSNTEIAFAVGAGDRMVGVSQFDDYPEQVKDIEKIGGQDFNVEKIISLKPDLVLALDSNAHHSKEGLDQLRESGIQVVVVQSASSFSDVYESINMIAKATGTTEKANQVIDGMKSKVASIKEKAATIPEEDRVKVWLEVSMPPDMYTTGSNTFMNEMLEIINAKNVAADKKGWVKFSSEAAVKRQPDAIVITYGYRVDNAVKNVLNRDGWENVPAVKNKRVYSVKSGLVSRAGPRLAKGVEELASVIYPDVFKD